MACFVWEVDGDRRVLELDSSLLVVGRDVDADVRFDHPSVGGRHALVRIENGTCKLIGLGPVTAINGAKLVPDLPSTLDPGDFVQFGDVLVTFHHAAPPGAGRAPAPSRPPQVSPRAAARTAASRPGRAAPPAGRSSADVWKWTALALAFVVVGLAGALSALWISGPEVVPKTRAAELPVKTAATTKAPAVTAPMREPDPMEESEPESAPKPEPEPAGPPRAEKGALPPAGYAAVASAPDLVEFADGSFRVVTIHALGSDEVKVVGRDGTIYTVAQSDVKGIVDREDLRQRIRKERAALKPADWSRRLSLATWCARRHARPEARALVTEVLAMRPDEPLAHALRDALEDEQ